MQWSSFFYRYGLLVNSVVLHSLLEINEDVENHS
jgi:hypothetical protein